MRTVKKRLERIGFRSSGEDKNLIRRAASFIGVSTSAFVRSRAMEAAKKVIVEQETLILRERDRDIFLALLDSPPEPTSSLKAAMKRHKKKYD